MKPSEIIFRKRAFLIEEKLKRFLPEDKGNMSYEFNRDCMFWVKAILDFLDAESERGSEEFTIATDQRAEGESK